MNMKHIGAVVGWSLLALLAGGCGKPVAKETRKPTIVWVNPIVGHPDYNQQDLGFKQAAKDYGFEPVIVGPVSIDAMNMVTELENALVQKVDGIVTVPLNWSMFQPVYTQARQAGIPIVNTGADTPPAWRLSFVGTDTRAYGLKAAAVLAKKTGGHARICIMMSQLDVQNQVETRAAFTKALEPYPDMKIVVVESDKCDLALAVKKFEDVFRAYPQVDTVLMLEGTGGVAAARVAKETGLTEKMTILAVDDLAETIQGVRAGTIWGTLAQDFLRMGYESAAIIMDHRAGKPVPATVDSGLVLITKENVDSYADAMFHPPQRPAPASPRHD